MHPLVTDNKSLAVVLIGDELFTLGAIEAGAEHLAEVVLVGNGVDDSSHFFYFLSLRGVPLSF